MMMNEKELQVPVPWGHIAAKAWGRDSDRIVLVFHGILDNAGSFDRLIPHLPRNFRYICFDLPGHGKSSHFPPFFPYYSQNHLFTYLLITNHFEQDKYIIMGHSYGGQIGFLFAQIYPERVEKLIMLDTIHFFPVSVGNFRDYLRDKVQFTIDTYETISTGKPPTYTYEEALERLQNKRIYASITKEAAEALLQRSIIPTGNNDDRYYFSMDQRLKNFINPLHDLRYIQESIRKDPVTCPILIVMGRESELQQIVMKDVIKWLRRQRNVIIKFVTGDHDVHNNSPDFVAPYVSKFLLMGVNKL